jgi:hypothetical protein
VKLFSVLFFLVSIHRFFASLALQRELEKNASE